MDHDDKVAAKEGGPANRRARASADRSVDDAGGRGDGTPAPGSSARSGGAAGGSAPAPSPGAGDRPKSAGKKRAAKPNNVRKLRIERMMSKAELARRANLSPLTVDRVEKGYGCRMDTKRKILEALGLSLDARVAVFGEEE